jgi:hypothetical protein
MLRKYGETELRDEVLKEIQSLVAVKQPVHPAWLTHKICGSHRVGLAGDFEDGQEVEPVHVAFWRYSGYAVTRKLANAVIKDLDEADDDDTGEQHPLFPEYPLIRRHYVIRKDGVDVMVPTVKMTAAEVRERAALYARQSATQAEHSTQLFRYAEDLDAEAVAAIGGSTR